MCAILAFAFVGCTESGEENNANRLATPNFSLRAEGNIITVSWEEVLGAAYYEVALDPGSVEKTEKVIHRFENLEYGTEYKVSVRAIAPDAAKNSNAEVKSVKTEVRNVPQYREFYPM